MMAIVFWVCDGDLMGGSAKHLRSWFVLNEDGFLSWTVTGK